MCARGIVEKNKNKKDQTINRHYSSKLFQKCTLRYKIKKNTLGEKETANVLYTIGRVMFRAYILSKSYRKVLFCSSSIGFQVRSHAKTSR